MLMDRIIGAFTFKSGVYAEVEKDASFTNTAWIIVAAVALLTQVVVFLRVASYSVIFLVFGLALALLGFALNAYVIALVGKSLFNADVDFSEVVRVLGLAYVWGIASAILRLASNGLASLGSLILLAAFLVAVKEALDLDWGKTAVVVIIGFVVNLIIIVVVGGALGIGAAGAAGAF